ncbi:MAG: mannosyltransferase family protein [Candidatus Bathyarchaeota archaeon]|nr:mannosyltransferase family protein [Candidatus Bathyarchaeota archaeon]
MVITKIMIFAVGYSSAYVAVSEPSSLNAGQLLMNMFVHPIGDAPHYLYLAQYGYTNQGDPANFIVFFPLYPLLVRLITFDFAYINLSGLIISFIASTAAVIYLFKITRLDYDENTAKMAVLFLCIFPTAYFLCAQFTEALFLAVSISSLYYARRGSWVFAGFLGFLASLTRLAGLILLPALAVEYLHQRNWRLSEVNWRLFWVILPIFGFLIYLLINYQVTGDFFTFMEVERVHWYQTLDPLEGLRQTIFSFSRPYPDNFIIGYAQLIFAAFGLIMILVGAKLKLRLSYQVYMLLTWLLAVSTSFWISIPRYVIAMFPLFIVLGILSTKKPLGKILIITVSAVFLVTLFYFTWLFAAGVFVF